MANQLLFQSAGIDWNKRNKRCYASMFIINYIILKDRPIYKMWQRSVELLTQRVIMHFVFWCLLERVRWPKEERLGVYRQ